MVKSLNVRCVCLADSSGENDFHENEEMFETATETVLRMKTFANVKQVVSSQ